MTAFALARSGWTRTSSAVRVAIAAALLVADEDGAGAGQLVEFLSTNKFL